MAAICLLILILLLHPLRREKCTHGTHIRKTLGSLTILGLQPTELVSTSYGVSPYPAGRACTEEHDHASGRGSRAAVIREGARRNRMAQDPSGDEEGPCGHCYLDQPPPSLDASMHIESLQKGQYPPHAMIQCHTHGTHVATTTLDEIQQNSDHAPQPAPYLIGEEVGGQQDVAMDTDELLPRHRLFALRGRWDAVTFQDVAHGLSADCIAQVGQCTYNAVISPGAILLGHPYHYVFNLLRDVRTADRRLGLGTITLLVRTHTVPRQDGIGLGYCRYLFQSFFAQLLAHRGEFSALAHCELHPTLNLLAEEPIFGHQVGIAQAEFLIDGTRDRGEQLLPIHVSSTPVIALYWWGVWAIARWIAR